MLIAVVAAISVSIGSLLQGWDAASMSGANVYIAKEFELGERPGLAGLIVAMPLAGGIVITLAAPSMSDHLSRRAMLLLSSVAYFLGGLLMLWSPTVALLLAARLVYGFGLGFACNVVSVYISETSPPAVRGLLNTIPQLMFTAGMFLSYCTLFFMSSAPEPDWRLMIGAIFLPALLFFALMAFFLPESPRWLVTKGRMEEAKVALQRLRGTDDVAGDLALLVEGLRPATGNTAVEEYIVQLAGSASKITLYGPDAGVSWREQAVRGQSALGGVLEQQRHGGSVIDLLTDPVVGVFGVFPEGTGTQSILFRNANSPMTLPEEATIQQWDDEAQLIRSPLLSADESSSAFTLPGTATSSLVTGTPPNSIAAVGIGGGWQLAWRESDEDPEMKTRKVLKKMYLHEDAGDPFRAVALVSKSALNLEELKHQLSATTPPAPAAATIHAGKWSDLLEPGVLRALLVGMAIQSAQQLTGVGSLLRYNPTFLENAGVAALFPGSGMSTHSLSILVSSGMMFLMLPCIVAAMRLMDRCGRRGLLLATLPVQMAAMAAVAAANTWRVEGAGNGAVSLAAMMVCFGVYSMGIGPIPGLYCSEIFPTRVRSLCITICMLTYWAFAAGATLCVPAMLRGLGIAGTVAVYAGFSALASVFVYLRLPETKGLPIEVVVELFKFGAQARRN